MRTFVVSGYLTVSVVATVEAQNIQDARNKAELLSAPGLCFHCSSAGEHEGGSWTLDGFDDPPDDAIQDVVELEG